MTMSQLRTGLAYGSAVSLKVSPLPILRFPLHRHQDAVPAAGMIEEDPLLQGTRRHLPVLAQEQGRLREAVGLARRVDAEEIRLRLVGADDGVGDRRHDEEIEGKQCREER